MAALPSPTVVAGSHNPTYEAYYQQIDPNGQGRIEAVEAARFLKKSKLSDVMLSKIWDLSDPGRKGYLDKNGFFVALKLCSLAQSGRDLNILNITSDSPPPKMGDLPKGVAYKPPVPPPVINNTLITSDWAVKPAERAKYDQLFESLKPIGGMLPGNKVRGVLMESKLPVDTLGKIWDLADMDKDGMLDGHEFMVAMHLVYKALDKHCIPNALPPELMPPAKRKESEEFASFPASIPIVHAPPPVPVAPQVHALPNFTMAPEVVKPPVIPPQPVAPWVVNTEEKAKYDTLFLQTDVDKDGFVSGHEIRDVFLRSGVPQPVLAHIWSLCDMKQSGKLNGEQFALAMWLINQTLLGKEPPPSLTLEMTPPCFRATKPPPDGIVENNNAPYSNPELDMITKDIEELAREKHILETDIAQKEADIKIKNGEIKSLQSELDTLAATLKQLENQKGEAQKRLNDLKGQKSTIDKELNDIQLEIEEEQSKVDNLRRQADEQETTLKTQEDELSSKKQELENLKREEASLEQKQKDSRNQLEALTKQLQDTQLQISQAKAKITHLQEQSRQMGDAIAQCDGAIATGDGAGVTDTMLNIAPEFQDAEIARMATVDGASPVQQNKTFNHNTGNDPFSNMNGPTNGTTAFNKSEDLFSNGPFQNSKPNHGAADPFTSNDPFNAAFPAQPADGFDADPFNSFGGPAKTDPFDPFGDGNNRGAAKSPADMSGKDPFGCDPFAILHAPTASSGPPPRPESPSPALPPKKSKQPPPRPAPPRPLQQPTMRAAPLPPTPSPDPFAAPSSAPQGDAFGGSGGGTNAFADFANFDAKFANTKDDVLGQSVKNVPKLPTAQKSVRTTSNRYAGMEFTEDPFRNYRYEDPFNIADPFDDEESEVRAGPTLGGKVDPFGLASDVVFDSDLSTPKTNGGGAFPEEQQLAWAAAESIQLEGERRRRLQQEQADLEYALALSRRDKAN